MSEIDCNLALINYGEDEIGNAVFIDNNRAITLKHCLMPTLESGKDFLFFCYDGTAFAPQTVTAEEIIDVSEDNDGFAILRVKALIDVEEIVFTECKVNPFESCSTIGFNKNHKEKPYWKQIKSNDSRIYVEEALSDLAFINTDKEITVGGLSGSPILPDKNSNRILGLVSQQNLENGTAIDVKGISVSSQKEFLRRNNIKVEVVENLKEISGNLENGTATSYAVQTFSIESILKDSLQHEKKTNPSMKMTDINDNIFSKCQYIQKVRIEGIINGTIPDSCSLIEAIKYSWTISQHGLEKQHISMYGIGGIGKTVSLLSLNLDIPFIYVALNRLDNGLTDYIKRCILLRNEAYWTAFNNLCIKPWNEHPSVIIILDGMNEINDKIRQSLCREIENEWLAKEGVQFIISSRYDVSMDFYRTELLQLCLEKLDRSQVKKYLAQLCIPIPDSFDEIWNVIDTPLMLNLYAATEAIKNHINRSRIVNIWEIINPGSIIWNYLQYLLYKYQVAHENVSNYAKVVLFIAPYIAYKMYIEGLFSIDSQMFRTRWTNEAIITFKNLDTIPVTIVDIITQLGPDRKLRKSNIYTILVKELCLLYDYAGKVSWMHQHFRDAMAAIYLYEMAQTGDNKGLALWKDKMDPYVENFLGNLLQAEKSGNTWDRIWYLYKSSNEPSDPEFIERMLRIYRVAYGRNISHIDFSGIDLGNVLLSDEF